MKRYDMVGSGCVPDSEGEWVLHDDALAAMKEARDAEREQIAKYLDSMVSGWAWARKIRERWDEASPDMEYIEPFLKAGWKYDPSSRTLTHPDAHQIITFTDSENSHGKGPHDEHRQRSGHSTGRDGVVEGQDG